MAKDNERKIHELKDKIKEFCDKRNWDQFHNAKELAIALSIEASELLEIFRWKKIKEDTLSRISCTGGHVRDSRIQVDLTRMSGPSSLWKKKMCV